jgi:hypothetical protein
MTLAEYDFGRTCQIYRVYQKSLRGHIKRTPRTKGMAPVPNSTSGHVDIYGIFKKTIRCIADLRPILEKRYFRGFFDAEKVKKW